MLLWVTAVVSLSSEQWILNTDTSFLKHHLGAATPENPEIELLRLELAEMKEKYEAIVEENKKLKTKVNFKKEFILKVISPLMIV